MGGRDEFSEENLGRGPKKIENHWYILYIKAINKYITITSSKYYYLQNVKQIVFKLRLILLKYVC